LHPNKKGKDQSEETNDTKLIISLTNPSSHFIPNPTKQRHQTKTPQPKFQNGTNTKGGQGDPTKRQLQDRNVNFPPIPPHHPHHLPTSLTETNHRHLLIDFADWLQNGKHTRAPLPQNFNNVTPTTFQDFRFASNSYIKCIN
jgi:hypothetical protein